MVYTRYFAVEIKTPVKPILVGLSAPNREAALKHILRQTSKWANVPKVELKDIKEVTHEELVAWGEKLKSRDRDLGRPDLKAELGNATVAMAHPEVLGVEVKES